MKASRARVRKAGAPAYLRKMVEEALHDGPLPAAEIAQRLDRKEYAVRQALRDGRSDKPKTVYVHRWLTSADRCGRRAAVFALGNKPDAPAPEVKRVRKPEPRKFRVPEIPEPILDTQALRVLGHSHDPFGRIPL